MTNCKKFNKVAKILVKRGIWLVQLVTREDCTFISINLEKSNYFMTDKDSEGNWIDFPTMNLSNDTRKGIWHHHSTQLLQVAKQCLKDKALSSPPPPPYLECNDCSTLHKPEHLHEGFCWSCLSERAFQEDSIVGIEEGFEKFEELVEA